MEQSYTEINNEIYKIFTELVEKYKVPVRYTFGKVINGKCILAVYTPEENVIVFNLPVLSKMWEKNKYLTKKLLRAVVYHEYYHYLRGNGYTVFADHVIKVYYPKVLINMLGIKPVRLYEEYLAKKFEKCSGINPENARIIAANLLKSLEV